MVSKHFCSLQIIIIWPCIVPVWYAARATSAAPIYFTPLQNKYLDGGVKANNPCLEAMRVIKEYDQFMGLSERHFLLAVSIGTGMYADKVVGGDDLEKGLPLIKHVKHLKQLVNLFIQEVCYMGFYTL